MKEAHCSPRLAVTEIRLAVAKALTIGLMRYRQDLSAARETQPLSGDSSVRAETAT